MSSHSHAARAAAVSGTGRGAAVRHSCIPSSSQDAKALWQQAGKAFSVGTTADKAVSHHLRTVS